MFFFKSLLNGLTAAMTQILSIQIQSVNQSEQVNLYVWINFQTSLPYDGLFVDSDRLFIIYI